MLGVVSSPPPEHVRIDKWLWAARFFKTRGLATDAVDGGKVEVNGQRAKPSKAIKPGDEVRLRLAPYEYILTVRGLAERRGPASAVAGLYEEDAGGKARREKLAEQIRLDHRSVTPGEGKPSKKDRRDLGRLKGRW
jgi:ribosome-associated heat shock protein Hsp15